MVLLKMFMNCLRPTSIALFEESKGWSDFALTLFISRNLFSYYIFYQINVSVRAITRMEGEQIDIQGNLA